MEPLDVLVNMMIIIFLLFIAAIIIGIILGAAYCFLCPIEFNQILFGPALFLYTIHRGDYISGEYTLDRFEKALVATSSKKTIARHLKISLSNLSWIRAAVLLRNAKDTDSSKPRIAVGIIITFESFQQINAEKLLEELRIYPAHLKLFSVSNWIVAFYPYFPWLHQVSSTVGLLRTVRVAKSRGWKNGMPMQIYPGNSTKFGAESDGMLTFAFGPKLRDSACHC